MAVQTRIFPFCYFNRKVQRIGLSHLLFLLLNHLLDHLATD